MVVGEIDYRFEIDKLIQENILLIYLTKIVNLICG